METLTYAELNEDLKKEAREAGTDYEDCLYDIMGGVMIMIEKNTTR